jgi:hypothetical protein
MSETQPVFNAEKYKRGQHDQWNEDSAAWHRWGPTVQRWLGDVTQRMLDLAQLGPKQRVLDIASGAGEPALSAADRVGPRATFSLLTYPKNSSRSPSRRRRSGISEISRLGSWMARIWSCLMLLLMSFSVALVLCICPIRTER